MSSNERQRIERMPGARRARLTPAPGTDPAPDTSETTDAPAGKAEASGPNDERMRRDVPPHW
ncbi:MAG: hypothetical protein QM622_06750 [Microbacterium sp.]